MSNVNLSGAELLAWSDETAVRWEKFLAANPAVLQLPCDIAGVKSVGELLQHIVAVELRYAQRLAAEPLTQNADVPYGSAEEIYTTHRRAMAMWGQLLAETGYNWAQMLEFTSRATGVVWKASAKRMFLQAMLHSIRHHAQLTTLVRHHGYELDWMGDFIGTETMK